MGLTIVAITESVDASLALVHDDKNEGKSVFFEQVSFENFRSFCWFPVFFRIMATYPGPSQTCCLPRDTGSTKKQFLPLYLGLV
jgi:hypothetical protein